MAVGGNVGIRICLVCVITWRLLQLVHIALDERQQQKQLPQLQDAPRKNIRSIVYKESFHQPPAAAGQQSSTNTTKLSSPKGSTRTESERESWNKIRTECFASNSDQWISGKVFSNNADGITHELMEALFEGPFQLGRMQSLFDQTICHPESPLLDFSKNSQGIMESLGNNKDITTATSIENWYQRFLFLALHWKFHRPALAEYKSRKQCAADSGQEQQLESFLDHHNIQPMDFECPGEKFVVIPIGNIGLGGFLHTRVALSIFLALRTHRTPIFLPGNQIDPLDKRSKPWLLAPEDCDRKDWQCYFLPVSPCTITHEELATAPRYGYEKDEKDFFNKNGRLPHHLEDAKIIVLKSEMKNIAREALDLREIAAVVIEELLGEWKKDQTLEKQGGNKKLEVMELAHQWLTGKATDDPLGLLRHLYLYMLRPNPHYKTVLEEQMKALVPSSMTPTDTIGIAIRASDKCKQESMCLSFDRFMELVTEVGYPALLSNNGKSNTSSSVLSAVRPKLIMTTEDPQVFNDSLAYQKNRSFPFEFLVNNGDNLQGSGTPREISSTQAEGTIVSSLVALKFQLHASKVYLNCCSNFHIVLKGLLEAQCGVIRHGHGFVFGETSTPRLSNATTKIGHTSLSPPPVATCLNYEDTPPRYRICCPWSKNCGSIRRKYLKEYGLVEVERNRRQKRAEKRKQRDKIAAIRG